MKQLAKAYALSDEAGVEFEPIAKATGFDYPEWPILTTSEPHNFTWGRWGLVPHWVKNITQAQKMRASTLNARAETLAEKPSFKNALVHQQRCIVPSTGFFEWQTVGKRKYPYFIKLRNQEVLSMAGLYEIWENEFEESTVTFTIVTVQANPLMEKIHNTKKRMPAILPSEGVSRWLDSSTPENELTGLLTPLDEGFMEAVTVRPLPKSSEKIDFSSLTRPYEYPELTRQLDLF